MNIKYYWINIDKCNERRLYMEEQFKEKQINNLRINASTPESLINDINDNPPYFCGNPYCLYNNCNDCKFEYSCIASHLRAIKKGYEELTDENYFIVCEDDIFIPFKPNFNLIIENLPKDFDIFQMMVLDKDASEKLYNNHYKKQEYYVKHDVTKSYWSTGMYLISKNGAKKLIDFFYDNNTNKFHINKGNSVKQADVLLYVFCNTYTSTIPLCVPNLNFISEIHPHHMILHRNSIIKMCEIANEGLQIYPFIS